MIIPTNEPQLTVNSVLAAARFTSIANNEQKKRDTNGIFWAILIGLIGGSMFAISYAMYH